MKTMEQVESIMGHRTESIRKRLRLDMVKRGEKKVFFLILAVLESLGERLCFINANWSTCRPTG